MNTTPLRRRPILVALICLALHVGVYSPDAAQTNRLTTSQILAKFVENQDRITSFIAEHEFSRQDEVFGSQPWKGRHWWCVEIRYDGRRFRERDRLWGQIVPDMVRSKDRPYYKSTLLDGQWRYQYDQAFWRVEDIRDRRQGTGTLMLGRMPARPIAFQEASFGALYFAWGVLPNDAKRIDARLKQAVTIRMREKLELAGWQPSPCYVLEGQLADEQHYTVWLDPTHGFQMAKGILRRNSGYRPSPIYTLQEDEYDFSFVEKVRFAKFDDAWVPVEATGGLDNVRVNYRSNMRLQVKVTKFMRNPDHEALRSFVPDDIRDGALVYADGLTNANGSPTRCQWQDGRVLDNTGATILIPSPRLIEIRRPGSVPVVSALPGAASLPSPPVRAASPDAEGRVPLGNVTLEGLRQAVASNEAKLNPIRLRFTTTFDKRGEAPEPEPGFRKPGRRFSHIQCDWAQKGERHYAKLAYYDSPEELWRAVVYVVDEANWTSAELPDWSLRVTQPREDLKWNAEIQVTTLGLRPFEGDYTLSEVLQEAWASFSGRMETIDGKAAAVVDARRRGKRPEALSYFARFWIDPECGVAVRIEYFDLDASNKDRHLLTTIDAIRHVRLPNGGWFPIEGTRTLHFPNRSKSERIKVETDSITVKPVDIPDSLFTLNAAPPN